MKGVKNNLSEKQKSGCSTNARGRAQGRAIWGALQHPRGKGKEVGAGAAQAVGCRTRGEME